MSERVRPPEDIPAGEFFTRWIGDAVAGDPDRRSKLGGTEATVEFELTGNPAPVGTWTVQITGGRVSGREGAAPEADLHVRVDEATWRDLNAGRISAPEALLRRRVHVRGSFLLALKLHLILG